MSGRVQRSRIPSPCGISLNAESSNEPRGPREHPREFLPMPRACASKRARASRSLFPALLRPRRAEDNNRHVTGAIFADAGKAWIASANNNIARLRKRRRAWRCCARTSLTPQALRRIDSSSAMNPWLGRGSGCISAVIVASRSRELLRPLTQFRVLSLISIED